MKFNKAIPVIFIISLLIVIGCTPIANKDHVKTQIEIMYEGNTQHPMKALAERFNAGIDSGNLSGMDNTEYFNRKCRNFIQEDPILKEYFYGFIKRSKDKSLSISNLNFNGIPAREQLEKELGVSLLE